VQLQCSAVLCSGCAELGCLLLSSGEMQGEKRGCSDIVAIETVSSLKFQAGNC